MAKTHKVKHRRKGPCRSEYREERMCRVYKGTHERTGRLCGKSSKKARTKNWPKYRRCKPGTIRIPN